MGLLKDGSMHGYQLKKVIDGTLGAFAGVASKSVYYALKRLEKKTTDCQNSRKRREATRTIHLQVDSEGGGGVSPPFE